MIVAAITMDDTTGERWRYRLQYLNKMYLVDVPNPVEAMSVSDQEMMMNNLFYQAFQEQRLKKLMQTPEEALEEGLEQAMKNSIRSPAEEYEEDEELEEDEDLLIEILNRLTEQVEKIMNKLGMEDE